MPCQQWFDLVDQYRTAVHSYGTAVDNFRTDSEIDFDGAWQRAERARKNADHARAALLFHERHHTCLAARAAAARAGIGGLWNPDLLTEDLILGDQGQSGG
jgi:hypothetical protein